MNSCLCRWRALNNEFNATEQMSLTFFEDWMNISFVGKWHFEHLGFCKGGSLLYTATNLQTVLVSACRKLQLISFPYILNLLQIYLILNNYYSLVRGICYYSTLHSHKLSTQCILINLCQSCINLILFKFNKDQDISKHRFPWEK